jgi:multicomponent Na+:H+ antiporter subunit G
MNIRDVIAVAFLIIGVGFVVLSCIGVLVMRNAYDRLHYVGPASVLSPVAIAAAVVVKEGLSQSGVKAILIALVLLFISPVLSHATARAAYVREFGNLDPRDDGHDEEPES